jgi:hypothetical protein
MHAARQVFFNQPNSTPAFCVAVLGREARLWPCVSPRPILVQPAANLGLVGFTELYLKKGARNRQFCLTQTAEDVKKTDLSPGDPQCALQRTKWLPLSLRDLLCFFLRNQPVRAHQNSAPAVHYQRATASFAAAE